MRDNEVRKMAALTSKGRLTIPREIREYLNLRPGVRDVRELKGILRSPRRKPVSVAEMNQAITEGFGKALKSRKATGYRNSKSAHDLLSIPVG
jgi:antitoxin PrlF